jgi:sigma-B regulation protein RsbU (phosphoserine phosphatase)
MAEWTDSQIERQLAERHEKLHQALSRSPNDAQLKGLLAEVDAAIERVNGGCYGLCEICTEPIEPDRLAADPLVRVCLDHMTSEQQRALEEDLELASQIQSALLPRQSFDLVGWATAYHYEGAGPVSGDYCDLLGAGEDLYFLIGDVSGKGVAASMLMAHLHASFRALVSLGLPLDEVMARASRMFCESTLPTHFATLVCGRAHSTGEVELCNAGHHPPLLLQSPGIEEIQATGLPLGLFCEESFTASELRLEPGDAILLYTDGLVEAVDKSGVQYGSERLRRIASQAHGTAPGRLISALVEDLRAFRGGAPRADDVTIMVIRRPSGI